MPRNRRPRAPGATIYFTVNLAHRGSDLLVAEIERLREAVRVTREERPFLIDAWVVLPDHLHCIWTLPDADRDSSTRWRLIKSLFPAASMPATAVQAMWHAASVASGNGDFWSITSAMRRIFPTI